MLPLPRAMRVACAVLLVLAAPTDAQTVYDLVLRHGRVMDPETGLDAVRNIGIRNGRVAVITTGSLRGREVLDATGLVVAPGFIDLHSHAVDSAGTRWAALDGVTTVLELEEGAYPVGTWYAEREGRMRLHYGVAAGHIPSRVAAFESTPLPPDQLRSRADDPAPRPAWTYARADGPRLTQLLERLQRSLDDGALGIGIEVAESPGASREEIFRVFQLAARYRVPVYAHLRGFGPSDVDGSVPGFQEMLANAALTGASLHVVHLGSSGLRQAPMLLEWVVRAVAQGLDVSTEVYPYTAASTGIETALFDDGWQERLGITYRDLEWPPTGERLTEATFRRYRAQGGPVIIHMIPSPTVEFLVGHPDVIIASDAMPLIQGRGHPRGAGTFSRVLGKFVREENRISLMGALRKMTLYPAERLRRQDPAMGRKGRLKVGSDADITIFDPERIADRATFAQPAQGSTGVVHVLVGGTLVVRDGALVEGVVPGRPIRRAGSTTTRP